MLSSFSHRSRSMLPWMRWFIFCGLLLTAMAANAQATPDVGNMFANARGATVHLMQVLPLLSWLIGVGLLIKSIFMFRDWSNQGSHTTLRMPAMMALTGVLFICLPETISMVQATFSLGPNSGTRLMSEVPDSGVAGAKAAMEGVLLFVKLIGHIALLRGLWIMKKYSAGEQGAEVGRALTHIIAGAAAINIQTTVNLLAALVGANLPF